MTVEHWKGRKLRETGGGNLSTSKAGPAFTPCCFAPYALFPLLSGLSQLLRTLRKLLALQKHVASSDFLVSTHTVE